MQLTEFIDAALARRTHPGGAHEMTAAGQVVHRAWCGKPTQVFPQEAFAGESPQRWETIAGIKAK